MPRERRGTGRQIPEHEIDITFAASGGPGGQNVNKRETKAVLRWKVAASGSFNEAEKARLRENLGLTADGEVVLHCNEHRNQLQNKSACIDRLHTMVNEALKVQEQRKETKKSKGVRARELDDKAMASKKKQMRGRVDW